MKEKRDDWRRFVPERVYRDFWLLISTAFIVWLGIKALDAANLAQRATREIQTQRVDTILTSCQQQNARHDGTIVTTDRLLLRRVHRTLPQGVSLAGAERTYHHVVASLPPAARPAVVQGHDGTILLIQQLAPKQNCQQVVRRATQPQASAPPIQRQYPPVLPSRKG